MNHRIGSYGMHRRRATVAISGGIGHVRYRCPVRPGRCLEPAYIAEPDLGLAQASQRGRGPGIEVAQDAIAKPLARQRAELLFDPLERLPQLGPAATHLLPVEGP